MIMVQKFHSIHEIDPEFVPTLEALLQEEFPSFDTLVERHNGAPDGDVFTYFLFFGPTQNAPIGFAQVKLRKIPTENLIPWYQKLMFWKKEHDHWKEAIWKVGDGNSGFFVYDPKFSRSIKEKVLEIFKSMEGREDIKAQHVFYLKGLQDFQSSWSTETKFSKDTFVLEPLAKASKSYEDYLNTLGPDVSKLIQASWKKLHKDSGVKLGDYPSVAEIPSYLSIDEKTLATCKKLKAQVLTFEKNKNVLGCLIVLKGRGGNIFIEPLPFEAESESSVSDDLYIQYALLKFYEMTDSRKCHMMKFGAKLVFEEKEDLKFFQEQGFQHKTVTQFFASELPQFRIPV